MVIVLKGHKPDNFESQVTLVGVSFIILIDYIIFFSPFLDVRRMSMLTVSFLAQLDSVSTAWRMI